MTTFIRRPKFMNSPYFVNEFENWHMKPGASQEDIDELEAFMRSVKLSWTPLPEGTVIKGAKE